MKNHILILFIVLSTCVTCVLGCTKDNYDLGLAQGYEKGVAEGYEKGNKDGHEEGYAEGYEKGSSAEYISQKIEVNVLPKGGGSVARMYLFTSNSSTLVSPYFLGFSEKTSDNAQFYPIAKNQEYVPGSSYVYFNIKMYRYFILGRDRDYYFNFPALDPYYP